MCRPNGRLPGLTGRRVPPESGERGTAQGHQEKERTAARADRTIAQRAEQETGKPEGQALFLCKASQTLFSGRQRHGGAGCRRPGQQGTMGHLIVTIEVVVIVNIYIYYYYYYDSGHFQVAFGMGCEGREKGKPPVNHRRLSFCGVNTRIRRSRTVPGCR